MSWSHWNPNVEDTPTPDLDARKRPPAPPREIAEEDENGEPLFVRAPASGGPEREPLHLRVAPPRHWTSHEDQTDNARPDSTIVDFDVGGLILK